MSGQERHCMELFEDMRTKRHHAVVGLDTDYIHLPLSVLRADVGDAMFDFNARIVEVTADVAAGYKLNLGFYFKKGLKGLEAMYRSVQMIHEIAPGAAVIADVKTGDIGSSNEAWATGLFDEFGFDAATFHFYTGKEAMQPFLVRADKAIIILCRTSNPGGGEFQDLEVVDPKLPAVTGKPLYQVVAQHVAEQWNYNGNCMIVAGATYPAELRYLSQHWPEQWKLIPAVGKQGGKAKDVVENATAEGKFRAVINSSRGVILAYSDEKFLARHPEFRGRPEKFAEAARVAMLELDNEITATLALV
ncbi:MAG: orotidine-5'-phosphate decarboxylase [bacterium]|nr:orotidine-5'-phosphate decarboxylase [bacterium]MDZ4342254.1 orotidine-5'-phosphate decarboxylase [Candidatus Binatia bacterium]